MPPLLPYLRDDELQRFVQRPVSRLPSFQLVEGPIHHSLPHGSVVLLGDSIKAVKPYFGQGANSALEDVSVLHACLADANDDPVAAAAAFTARRAEDARALVRISRGFVRRPVSIPRALDFEALDLWTLNHSPARSIPSPCLVITDLPKVHNHRAPRQPTRAGRQGQAGHGAVSRAATARHPVEQAAADALQSADPPCAARRA